jgi:hypothetical protein
MSEKIRGFISRDDLDWASHKETDPAVNLRYSKNKITENDVEVEITIIEPVYEYLLLLRKQDDDDEIILSVNYYIDTDEYLSRHAGFFEPIRIIEETKRIRK